MPLLHAIILGLVQGFSEFLPISSSGHLNLVPWLLGWNDFAGKPELETTFDVALHLGTFIGAASYFRHDLVNLGRSGIIALRPRRVPADAAVSVETSVSPAPVDVPDRPAPADEVRLAWLLLASAIPAALTGAVLEDKVQGIGDKPVVIGMFLIVFGLVLLWADRLGGRRTADTFTFNDAATMGVAQALALMPGVSRSGVTITAARARGFDRDAAARLSFLMSLVIIAGAILYKGLDVVRDPSLLDGFEAAFAVGIVTSAVSGWVAVWGTMKLIRTRTFTPFVVYRVVLGVAVILIAVTGLR
jgi:undecaprenyl-diphosphatase